MNKASNAIIFLLSVLTLSCTTAVNKRQNIFLNGEWEIEKVTGKEVPTNFTHKIQVPGFADMAVPGFDSIGLSTSDNCYLWYHKRIGLQDINKNDIAFLKISKAAYGVKVLINGKPVGESFSCFTPIHFDIKEYLNEGDNDILIRVGARRKNLPDSVPDGRDGEKVYYMPGIYDDVQLVLGEKPFIKNIQVVPMPFQNKIKIMAWIESNKEQKIELGYSINEFRKSEEIFKGHSEGHHIKAGIDTMSFEINMEGFKWWSPESPTLYTIKLYSCCDEYTARFGMRTFAFDTITGKAILNGKPYFMRGTNISFLRFTEDSARGRLPWDTAWIKALHQKMKYMHYNCFRNSIGFPPELWYEIADEQGFLIQDEFPIWYSFSWPAGLKVNTLVNEYKKWMAERWNHPSVVIWDAQNETWYDSTQRVIAQVRHLDLSNRPWDNGCNYPHLRSDSRECHPYRFHHQCFDEPAFYIDQLEAEDGTPDWPVEILKQDGTRWFQPTFLKGVHPFIINEYCWLWLNRDGSATKLTEKVYESLAGKHSTTEQRRYAYARNLAALTEFWRCNRKAAAVMNFTFLTFSRTHHARSYTCDNFTDVKKLELDPYFVNYVRDAFSPVGLMINKWKNNYRPSETVQIPIVVINDLDNKWSGKVSLVLDQKKYERDTMIDAYGSCKLNVPVEMPAKKGEFLMEARLVLDNDTVSSYRTIIIH